MKDDAEPEMLGTPEEVASVMLTIAKDTAPDYTVTRTELTGAWAKQDERGSSTIEPGFEISWGTKSAGFGTLTFYVHTDGKLRVDNECMGKKFCGKVLEHFLSGAHDPRNHPGTKS